MQVLMVQMILGRWTEIPLSSRSSYVSSKGEWMVRTPVKPCASRVLLPRNALVGLTDSFLASAIHSGWNLLHVPLAELDPECLPSVPSSLPSTLGGIRCEDVFEHNHSLTRKETSEAGTGKLMRSIDAPPVRWARLRLNSAREQPQLCIGFAICRERKETQTRPGFTVTRSLATCSRDQLPVSVVGLAGQTCTTGTEIRILNRRGVHAASVSRSQVYAWKPICKESQAASPTLFENVQRCTASLYRQQAVPSELRTCAGQCVTTDPSSE
ncbi:hypothetical protein MPTK1_3g16060 [Marchantia polymorpha subsp. ruderalis]|uniref:Uncharacterized protein n=2 Tax=Marchantia polymorpha TaxID=3197 RepID=A0AAF6B1B6_MARPO|nr:hypothetical protein MARPO_0004s0066 [Marchantia polymorpha]BBN05800.1 hypothetical protein Mp_3g16060 [Marchantia polymorpha subsp. ruderalis]|eukprot:PTQ48778.1 hypothetical protein MARPO_0004s0066 [Marchantia polymorpha]